MLRLLFNLSIRIFVGTNIVQVMQDKERQKIFKSNFDRNLYTVQLKLNNKQQ